MEKTFAPAEFVQALQKGEIRETASLVGMVKLAEDDTNALMFTSGPSCDNWTKIPLKFVDKIEHLQNAPCKDHEHPVVRLVFKDQEGLGSVLLGLFKAVSAAKSKGPSAFPSTPQPAYLATPQSNFPPGMSPTTFSYQSPSNPARVGVFNTWANPYPCNKPGEICWSNPQAAPCPYNCACYVPSLQESFCSYCCIG